MQQKDGIEVVHVVIDLKCRVANKSHTLTEIDDDTKSMHWVSFKTHYKNVLLSKYWKPQST